MIKKPKKQLYNFISVFLTLLVSILLGFFLLAIYNHKAFFHCLIFCLIASIGIMISFHQKYLRHKMDVDLRKQDIEEENNLLIAELDRDKAVIDSFKGKIVNYSALKDVTEKLCSSFTLESTTQVLSAEVKRLFDKKDGTVLLYLFHSKTGELGISSSKSDQLETNIKAKKGDIYDMWVARNMKALLIEDVHTDFRFDVDKISDEENRGIGSLMSVPLLSGTKAIGILRVDCQKRKMFTVDDLRFLTTLGTLGAVAIENSQLYEHIQDLAIHDSLTGLLLRRFFLESLSKEFNRQARHKRPVSFLMIDLDNFKAFNDRHGHIAGDSFLKAVAEILKETFLGPGDLVCRYGGEEFAAVLPDCPKEEAMKFAELIRRKVSRHFLVVRRRKLRTTVSIGVAAFPLDAEIKEQLIEQADQALYRAKAAGRNKVQGC